MRAAYWRAWFSEAGVYTERRGECSIECNPSGSPLLGFSCMTARFGSATSEQTSCGISRWKASCCLAGSSPWRGQDRSDTVLTALWKPHQENRAWHLWCFLKVSITKEQETAANSFFMLFLGGMIVPPPYTTGGMRWSSVPALLPVPGVCTLRKAARCWDHCCPHHRPSPAPRWQ